MPDPVPPGKLAATARWLTRFVRASRVRDPSRFVDASLDRGTLDELREVVHALAPFAAQASSALGHIDGLRASCDRAGNLPTSRRHEVGSLVGLLEASLQ